MKLLWTCAHLAMLGALATACGQEVPARDPGVAGAGAMETGGAAAGAMATAGAAPMAPDALAGAGAVDTGSPSSGASYYPLADGARWVYAHSGGAAPWTEEVTVSATTHLGQPAFEMRDTPGPGGIHTVQTIVLDGTLARRVHKQELTAGVVSATMDYDPGFPRFDDAWPGQGAGASFALDYRRVELDAAGVLVSDEQRSHRYEMLALVESVTVPAGTFADCVEVRRERIRVGTAPASGDVKTFWFCAGVGKVRETEDLSGKFEELVSCSLPTGPCAP